MLRLYASQFVELVSAIETARLVLKERVAAGENEDLSSEYVAKLFSVPVSFSQEFSEQLGLRNVITQIERIESERKFPLNNARVLELLGSLSERLADALEDCWFFFVPEADAKLYREPLKDWGTTETAFTSPTIVTGMPRLVQ